MLILEFRFDLAREDNCEPVAWVRERPEVPPQVVTDVVSSSTHAWSTVGIHIAPEGIPPRAGARHGASPCLGGHRSPHGEISS